MRAGYDAVATAVVWTPILVLITAVVLAVHGGVATLEAHTYGTSYIVPEQNPRPQLSAWSDAASSNASQS
jgi:hypothetical protein